jgi:hypothetical protein
VSEHPRWRKPRRGLPFARQAAALPCARPAACSRLPWLSFPCLTVDPARCRALVIGSCARAAQQACDTLKIHPAYQWPTDCSGLLIRCTTLLLGIPSCLTRAVNTGTHCLSGAIPDINAVKSSCCNGNGRNAGHVAGFVLLLARRRRALSPQPSLAFSPLSRIAFCEYAATSFCISPVEYPSFARCLTRARLLPGFQRLSLFILCRFVLDQRPV